MVCHPYVTITCYGRSAFVVWHWRSPHSRRQRIFFNYDQSASLRLMFFFWLPANFAFLLYILLLCFFSFGKIVLVKWWCGRRRELSLSDVKRYAFNVINRIWAIERCHYLIDLGWRRMNFRCANCETIVSLVPVTRKICVCICLTTELNHRDFLIRMLYKDCY